MKKIIKHTALASLAAFVMVAATPLAAFAQDFCWYKKTDKGSPLKNPDPKTETECREWVREKKFIYVNFGATSNPSNNKPEARVMDELTSEIVIEK